MQCTTEWQNCYRQWDTLARMVVVLSLVLLALGGLTLESLNGWLAYPPVVVAGHAPRRRPARRRAGGWGFDWRSGWRWRRGSWVLPLLRSEVLLSLVWLNRVQGWEWLSLLPWVAWLWQGVGVMWPGLGRQPVYAGLGCVWVRASGLALVGLGLAWVTEQRPVVGGGWLGALALGVESDQSEVVVEEDAAGVYHVQLRGTFELHVDGRVEFAKRLLAIFLGLLDAPGAGRGSRRTRDGRMPLVRQEQLAVWFGVPQPVISRWCGYWLRQDWRCLLSQRWGEVLTQEVQQRIIACWVLYPWWSAQQVWQHLQTQGSAITLNQVKQAGRESGWTALRQTLTSVYRMEPESFRPRDEWLTRQLLAQVQGLVAQLEAVGGLPPEQQVALADLAPLCAELALRPAEPRRPLPWVLQLEQLLFGHWQPVEDGRVQCIYCGTHAVSRKSRQPKLKKYVDAQGAVQTVEVYRYYCHNSECSYQTFTDLPANLLPYSPWPVAHHLAALQLYEWSHSVYRCTSQMLGVSKMTVYRWVSGFGYDLLPVAALFGVVRASGVVGIDEKYVLVPKACGERSRTNDKPESDMQRWMYVYVAVDCYTYDLLHIELYPYNTKESAHAFLLALRAKSLP